MRFGKFINSKIYRILEMVFNLIVLNIITLLLFILGLGVFSIMPAIVALIIVLRSLKSDRSVPIFRGYYLAFKANYFRVLKLSLFYLMIGLLFLFNTYFFYSALLDWQGFINEILYYLWLAIDVVFIISFINACFICVYFPNLNNKKVIKYSFKLLMAIPVKAFILIVILISFIITMYLIPLLAIFIVISLFFYLANLLIENTYLKLVADGVKPLDASDYLYEYEKLRDSK